MGQKSYSIQLKDHLTGEVILGAGGLAFVTAAGSTAKLSLLTATGAALANPPSLTQGRIEFEVADTVTSVDIHGIAPGGQAFAVYGVKPGGPNEVAIDTNAHLHTLKIPFHADDQVGDATETPTGFTVPDGAMLLPNAALYITAIDATETMDVGTEGTSDDPDGFLDGVSLGTLGIVKGTLADGAQTLGVLLKVDESSGDFVPEGNVSAQADEDSISYTMSAGSTTAAGYILLPYMLP